MQLSIRRCSPVWPESSPEKREKTTPIPRLPGAITLPSELQFTRTLYRWKVDVASFPTICRMTHFEHQKASKSCLENQVKKQYAYKNRGRFSGGAAWRIRIPRGVEHAWHTPITRRAPQRRARRAALPIKRAIPPPPISRCDLLKL